MKATELTKGDVIELSDGFTYVVDSVSRRGDGVVLKRFVSFFHLRKIEFAYRGKAVDCLPEEAYAINLPHPDEIHSPESSC